MATVTSNQPVISEALREQYRANRDIVTDYVHPHSLNSKTPQGKIPPPEVLGAYPVDRAVAETLPIQGSTVEAGYRYGSSMWAITVKVTARLPSDESIYYFLKIIPNEFPGRYMAEGEYESLKAIYQVHPGFVPEPYGWGRLHDSPGYFLLTEFRDVGRQPADPRRLAQSLAKLHHDSVSPTGKFGFHVITCHGSVPQDSKCWEESWTTMFTRILSRAMDVEDQRNPPTPVYTEVRALLFRIVVPRLLDPLQSEGRSIKPCLVHGDVWDENCANDRNTGQAFAFDSGALYAHNEYELGFWRPPRFRLSSIEYFRAYKERFPVSAPVEDWDDRNLLYSLRINVSCATFIPSSNQKLAVLEDMQTLCRKFAPAELAIIEAKYPERPLRASVNESR